MIDGSRLIGSNLNGPLTAEISALQGDETVTTPEKCN